MGKFLHATACFLALPIQYEGFNSRRTKMANTNTMLKALLGLAVVAGWQNRDKIGEFVKGVSNQGASGPAGGLSDILDSFRKGGLGEKADSWVSTGQNQPISEPEVARGIDPSVLDGLAEQTGLSREELLKRLSAVLPEMVDKMTPAGRL
jgi:uncharacterized protein YidB (DUF937 family)